MSGVVSAALGRAVTAGLSAAAAPIRMALTGAPFGEAFAALSSLGAPGLAAGVAAAVGFAAAWAGSGPSPQDPGPLRRLVEIPARGFPMARTKIGHARSRREAVAGGADGGAVLGKALGRVAGAIHGAALGYRLGAPLGLAGAVAAGGLGALGLAVAGGWLGAAAGFVSHLE